MRLSEAIECREVLTKPLRAQMRSEDYRIRPASTDRNVRNQIEDSGMKLKMLQMAGALEPFVKEYLEEREKVMGKGAGGG